MKNFSGKQAGLRHIMVHDYYFLFYFYYTIMHSSWYATTTVLISIASWCSHFIDQLVHFIYDQLFN
jgi:hypothetical protein